MPLTSDIKIEKKEGVDFAPLPKDIYQVELLDISEQDRPTYDTRLKPEAEQEIEKVFSFQFTLLDGKEGDKTLRGRNVWANFVPSYLYISQKNGKNMLYRITEGLLGRELTREEEATLSSQFFNGLIGKQCRVSVEPVRKGDKTYDKITDIYKSGTPINALTPEEKDKASVKKDKENVEADFHQENEPEEIIVNNIPF